jgi:streptomycin 6-kinase
MTAVRGEDVEEELTTLERYVRESDDPRAASWADDLRARVRFAAGRYAEAAAAARTAIDAEPWTAMWLGPVLATSAVLTGDVDSARWTGERQKELAGFGAWSRVLRTRVDAIVAAGEGRVDDALAAFTESAALSRRIGLLLEVALCGLDAALLLTDDPRVRPLAEEARAVFADLDAAPYLGLLDAAVASRPPDRVRRSESASAPQPAGG